MRRALIVAPVWMVLRTAMQSVFSLIGSQIKFLIDMEDAMARIQIVGKGTAEQYDSLKFSLIGLSIAYGVSASDAMEAAKIFAQQGKTVSETFLLTRAAMIGAQVLGQTVKVTVEDLTAAMKAFNIPAQNAISIMDQVISVEKEFAVTSVDLSSGIKVVGATANQMGISLAALAGDITAVVEVTRKSGGEAARGLQFIYARLLTTAKPVIEQLTGIKFYLDEQGKSTHTLTGKLRSATEILDELAKKWVTLSNEERLNIASATGSKRQLVVMNALMQNYTNSIDARITALTAAGQAEKAMIILQDTTTYKVKQLSGAWNTLTVAVADTSAWKGMIDIFGQLIIGWASFINYEKVYRGALAKESAEILTNIETRQSQINSVEELIKLRNKLLAEPPSDKTTERLEKVNQAIKVITQSNPAIKIALETGTPAELKKATQDISDKLLAQKIAVQVGVEFIPKIDILETEKKKLEDALSKAKPTKAYEEVTGITAKTKTQVKEIEQKIVDLQKQQTAEQEKQYGLAKAQNLAQDITDEEELINLSGELTSKEKEQLDIESKLNKFRLDSRSTLEQQIQREIELIKTSKTIYDLHDKTLKLQELENQLIDAKLKKKDEERNKMISLAMQYEKAGAIERDNIKRVTELMKLTPKELASAYENDLYDRRLITEYWSSFRQEGQTAIEDVAMRLADMPPLKTDFDIQTESFDKIKEMLTKMKFGGTVGLPMPESKGLPPTTPIINQTNKAAEQILIYMNLPEIGTIVPEDLAKLVGNEIEKKLLTDEDFQKAFGKKLSPKV
jgi:TP901 family phage tail tape measure protein